MSADSAAGQAGTPKGGRPSLSAERRRRRCIYVAVNDSEYARIARDAAACDRPVAAYVREVVMGHALTPKADRAAARELHYIGVNINQLARMANRTKRLVMAHRLEQLLKEFEEAKAALLS